MILLGKTVSMQKKAEFQFMHGQGKSVQIPPPVFAEAMSDMPLSQVSLYLNISWTTRATQWVTGQRRHFNLDQPQ